MRFLSITPRYETIPAVQRLMSALRLVGSLDLRSLALFRIALGVMIIADLIVRSQDLTLHYTDSGILPRSILLGKLSGAWDLCLHLIAGTVYFQAFLFLIAGLLAVSLIVGYRTKLSLFLSWVLLISLQVRNPLVLNGGDIVFRMLLFWANFLPLGKIISIDAHLDRTHVKPQRNHFSVGSIAMTLQISFIYIFAAFLKTGPEWHHDGSAVYYALHIDQFVSPLGIWLRQFTGLLKMLTHAVWYFELIGPLFLFCPWNFTFFRTLTTLLFILLHVGFTLTLGLGVFPWICIAGQLALLPSGFWDAVHTFIRKTRIDVDRSVSSSLGQPMQWAAGMCLILVFLWNLKSIPGSRVFLPSPLIALGSILKLDQRWDMFSPSPLKDDGWYVIPGKLENGQPADVMKFLVREVDWTKPKLLSSTFSSERTQKYFMNLYMAIHMPYRLQYGQYLCRTWNYNRTSPNRLEEFTIYFMREDTVSSGNTLPVKVSLWEHHCLE